MKKKYKEQEFSIKSLGGIQPTNFVFIAMPQNESFGVFLFSATKANHRTLHPFSRWAGLDKWREISNRKKIKHERFFYSSTPMVYSFEAESPRILFWANDNQRGNRPIARGRLLGLSAALGNEEGREKVETTIEVIRLAAL